MTHASGAQSPLGSDTSAPSAGESSDSGARWLAAWTESEGEDRARGLFRETFGEDPVAITSSPGRITLIGDHTDYSGGLSLPTVLPHRAYVAARARDDELIRVTSAQAAIVDGPDGVWEADLRGLATESGMGWVRHVAGVLWALAERGFPARGMDIAIDSCVPIGAGLGSSAAVQCAVALATNQCWGLALDTPEGRVELAEAAVDAEARFVGVPTGGLDQHAVLRCEPDEALLLDFASRPPAAIRQPLYYPEYGLCLLVIDTRTPHDLRDGQYAQRQQSCEAAAEALGERNLREVFESQYWLRRVNRLADPLLRSRARHVVTEMHRVRLVASELSGTAPAHERFIDLGKALYRSHASLDIDFEVSTDALNLAVDSAFRAGALGARLVGAGFGGAAIALVRKAQLETTVRIIDEAFIASGMRRPSFLARDTRLMPQARS
jgi:galactokinase